MIIRIYFVIFFSILLASCASTPQPVAMPVKTTPTSLQNLQSWEISGAIAVKNLKESGSATIHWHQEDRLNYRITLLGPIGTGSYELRGSPTQVELAASSGKHFYATSPEQLLLQQTGWALPISNLYYWIRGLAAPTTTAKKSFNAQGQLSELSQQGWTVKFLRFKNVHGIVVPDKIFLNNDALSVKIVINQWIF